MPQAVQKAKTRLDTDRVNHQKNRTDRNEADSLGHCLAGRLLVSWSMGDACWRGEMSANKHMMNDTITNVKRTHAEV